MPPGAVKLTIDTLTLYAAASDGGIISSTPPSSANLPIVLNGPAWSVMLSLPSGQKVMIRDLECDHLTQQVFLVLQYHFGTA